MDYQIVILNSHHCEIYRSERHSGEVVEEIADQLRHDIGNEQLVLNVGDTIKIEAVE